MVREEKTILITGGLGYVGGRLADYLHRHRPTWQLRLLTRRSVSETPSWAQPFKVIQGDVALSETLREAVQGVETVIHLASLNEVKSQRNPRRALEVNSMGTGNMLEVAQDAGVQRFIYFSTFHVYGPWAASLITEETSTRPVHPYAITHRLAEDFVNRSRYLNRMQTLILRLSNGYGYPMDNSLDCWRLVFNDLCRQALLEGRIVLRSSGHQQRDFIALSDVVRAVEYFLCLPEEAWKDGLFNLGSGRSMSVLQVAELIAAEFKRRYEKPITIVTGHDKNPGSRSEVHYGIKKLQMTSFSLRDEMTKEIQRTFEACEGGRHAN